MSRCLDSQTADIFELHPELDEQCRALGSLGSSLFSDAFECF